MRIETFPSSEFMAGQMRCLMCLLLLIVANGCSSYSALPSGSEAPAITANGWIHGKAPPDLDGNVVVLEVFATW